jgi:hypothetical protein
LRLAGVMLPELGIGVRVTAELRELAQRNAVGSGRRDSAGGEASADAGDAPGDGAPGERAEIDADNATVLVMNAHIHVA